MHTYKYTSIIHTQRLQNRDYVAQGGLELVIILPWVLGLLACTTMPRFWVSWVCFIAHPTAIYYQNISPAPWFCPQEAALHGGTTMEFGIWTMEFRGPAETESQFILFFCPSHLISETGSNWPGICHVGWPWTHHNPLASTFCVLGLQHVLQSGGYLGNLAIEPVLLLTFFF